MAWTSARPSSSCLTSTTSDRGPRALAHRLVSAKQANLLDPLGFHSSPRRSSRGPDCCSAIPAAPASASHHQSGMSMSVRRIGYRYQRTLLRPTEVIGIGFLTGAPIRLRFVPAPPSTGVVFVRTDLQQPLAVAAQVNMVSGTQRR